MGKILITGMSAPQVSRPANKRTLSFAGLLDLALSESGHEVAWGDPHLDMSSAEVKKFDAIFVGISPVTSLGANRVYGALGTIWSVLQHDPKKLVLFVDAPNTSQIETSLKAVAAAPESLVKEFYSYRKNYAEVKTNKELQARLLGVVDLLLSEDWPITIYPKLPWQSDTDVAKNLPSGVRKKLVGVNLDSYILESATESEERVEKWVSSDSKSKWSQKLLQTVGLPCFPVRTSKGSTDVDAAHQIGRAVGLIVAPDKKQNTWWSYQYIQAMNSLTPVATKWQESQKLGTSWAVLAAGIESSSPDLRRLIAISQRESYETNIPDKIEAVRFLEQTINLK